MKKMLQIGAFLCGMLLVQTGFAAYGAPNGNYAVNECPTQYCDKCPEDHAHPDQPCGDCYCLMVHYEPCYYTTQRCVEESIPCKKQCVRYVDKYYDVQRCRQVPEYYTETYCQKCPECYEVDDCKICKKMVCDQHCKWVPKYYWKHNQTGCCTPCNPGCCPR